MINNNPDRTAIISLLLRNVMRDSRDAYVCLRENDEVKFLDLIGDITFSIRRINIELDECSKEEYDACIKQMLEEERENGDE